MIKNKEIQNISIKNKNVTNLKTTKGGGTIYETPIQTARTVTIECFDEAGNEIIARGNFIMGIDGEAQYQGNFKNPLELSNIPYGTYTLSITIEGYERVTETITISMKRLVIPITLVPNEDIDVPKK